MNGSYFQNPTFPTVTNEEIQKIPQNDYFNIQPSEQITYDNLLKLNKGKKLKLFSFFNEDSDGKEKIFEGILENSFKDFIIISNPNNGAWYLIKTKDIKYIEFLEKIN